MKCTKCGAEIPANRVYCSVCGKAVQLVPDYNFLEDDMLSDIIQRSVDETASGSGNKDAAKKNKIFRKKRRLITGVCIFLTVFAFIPAVCLIVYNKIEQNHANSYEYQYQKANEYLAEKDYDTAQVYFMNALTLKPEDDNAQQALIHIYTEIGEKEKAAALLEERLARNPKDREDCEKLIALYAQDEEYDKIRALYDEIRDIELLDLFSDYLVEQPTFSRISGTYTQPLSITVSSEKGYDIYYTLDERSPIEYGILYNKAISLKEGKTVITAVTRNEKGIYSEAVKATYTVRYEAPSMPKVTPAGGTYGEPQMITVQVPSGCTAYYTWDGTDPTPASAVYSGPLEMPQGNQVLSVMLVNSAGLKSRIYRVNYIYMP